MGKEFYDLGYEVLSHYLNFPDVADTFKSINDGNMYLNNYPMDDFDFQFKKDKIITYIQKARIDNIIYQYHETNKVFVPSPTKKMLKQCTREELRTQLEIEISMLMLKGVHQVVMHLHPWINIDALSGELLENDIKIFDRYRL